jgi:RHS repeat-associated protein
LVYDAGGRLVAEYGGAASQTSGTSYVTQDTLGSTRVVTGQGGEVRGRYDYLPFGEEVYAGREGYGGGDIRQRFTGYERDGETGLDYAKARYYSSAAGRYASVDPIVVTPERFFDPQQFNLYSYTRNNPLRFIDPTGEKLVISGDINEIKKQLAEILGTEDAAKRVTFDEKTGTIKVDLTGIDLTKNEGASLLNDAISSEKVYGLSVGSSMETLGGQLSLIPGKDDGHSTMENLDNNPDSRYAKGKTDKQKPPKGVDDQIGVNYDYRDKNSKSTTNLPQAPNFTVTFHELAEAYAKVEHGKQYAEAHQEAIEREQRLRDQRPYLKGYNPGSGPGTTIIIRK